MSNVKITSGKHSMAKARKAMELFRVFPGMPESQDSQEVVVVAPVCWEQGAQAISPVLRAGI